MLRIRPVALTDLQALLTLAHAASIGLTTLPRDEELLRQRIEASVHALRPGVRRPAGETYLFVLEDLLTGGVVGCAGIQARVGGFEPFYTYEIRTTRKSSKELGFSKDVRSLHLVADHKGPTEIGTLFLHAGGRGRGAGRLLSLARFAFMAGFPERFDAEVIAEMRGVVDDHGRSPFWEAIGRHFFELDFAHADALSAADKQFIADLMPAHPIYIPMLPASAQAIIGEVHPETRPALRLLRQEGFADGGRVDIFDAGPLVRAERAAIRTIADARVGPLAAVLPAGEAEGPFIVSNDRLAFRACLGVVEVDEDGGVRVPRDVALALELRLGDPVRYAAARARPPAAR
ncbi:MAG: arginine N-succinyltransferase [Myxococcales bacterium]|nr:arginine N-succinyltransferase [Myxococcales bacterium]